MNSNTDHSEALELLHELLHIQHALPRKDVAGEPLLAVARLAPGLDMETWRKMAGDAALSGWCALEMTDDGRYRCQWQELADALPACGSLDASLQLSPFMQQLEKEILRAKRGQSEVSLILFAVRGGKDEYSADKADAATATTASMATATTMTTATTAADAALVTDANAATGTAAANTADAAAAAVEDSAAADAEANATLAALLRETAESCDSMGSMGAGRCALLLPGAGMYKAQNVAESICTRLNSGSRSCAAGIASARGREAEADSLVRQAAAALEAAMAQGRAVLVAEAPSLPEFSADTLVQSNEKRFLFGGEC